MVIIHSKVNSVALKTRSINDISSSYRNILLVFKLSSWVRNTFGEGWYFSTGVVWGYIMNFISKSTVGFQILEPVGMLECPVVPQSVSQSVSRMLAMREWVSLAELSRYRDTLSVRPGWHLRRVFTTRQKWSKLKVYLAWIDLFLKADTTNQCQWLSLRTQYNVS